MPTNLSSKRSSEKIKWLISLVFFSVLIFGLLYFSNEYFKVKEIKIAERKVLLIGLEDFKNRNLLFLTEGDIKNELLKKNPSIAGVDVSKRYPSTLLIKVTEDIPLANLVVSQGFFSLSSQGKILSKTKETNESLPVINYYQKLNFQSYKPGDVLTYKDILQALNLIKAVEEVGFKVDNVDITGVDVILFNLGDKKVIFNSEKETVEQIYQWQQIIRQFKVEGKSFREIDLRYDKPVVRF